MNNEKIMSFCKNKELCNIFDKYIKSTIQEGKDKEITFEFMFQKIVNDLSNSKCIIPILGVQGSGKSSFLNSLLFDDIILPVDADETTCIPTEICYGTNKKLQAKIYFSDGNVKLLEECSESAISEYVHQDHNPGNKKNISHIEITSNNELLNHNIVFVDLPGVGSITTANQNITLQYLKKFANAAILVIRTVPPITHSESIFIQGALPMLGEIFLLQNKWTDESREEVEDGKIYNYKILTDITKKLNLPVSKIQEPSIVCVKEALDGKMLKDNNLMKKSGLIDFIQRIINFAENYQVELKNNWLDKINQWLIETEKIIIKTKELLSNDKENALNQIKKRKKQQEEELYSKEKKLNEIKDNLCEEKNFLDEFIDNECSKAKMDLKFIVTQKINEGLTSGSMLKKAFDDELLNINVKTFDEIQKKMIQIQNNIFNKLADFNKLDISDKVDINVNSNFSEKTQVHSTYERIGSGGGAILGATLGSVIPGVGTIAGGLVGGLIGGLGGWFAGNKIKEYQIKDQKISAMEELRNFVNIYEETAKCNYKKEFSSFVSGLEERIDEWLEKEQNNISKKYKEDRKKLSIPIEEREKELLQLDDDLKIIKQFRQELI